MKSISLLFAAFLAIPAQAFAAETVKINIYLNGSLEQAIALTGPNASVKFVPIDLPNTTLELRLLAPEPIIVEMIETIDGGTPVSSKVKLATPGGSSAVAEIKGAKFKHAYVLTRPE